MNDGEERMICPFNEAHYILKARMATHLTQCLKNYPSSPLRLCIYNSLHYFDKSEIDAHMKNCPDRSHMERFVYTVGPSARDISHLVVQEAATSRSEDWDEVETPSYLSQREQVISQKPVFLQGNFNVGKAERKNFIKSEKMRMQQLASDATPMAYEPTRKAGSSVGVNDRPRTMGRGRGRGTVLGSED